MRKKKKRSRTRADLGKRGVQIPDPASNANTRYPHSPLNSPRDSYGDSHDPCDPMQYALFIGNDHEYRHVQTERRKAGAEET